MAHLCSFCYRGAPLKPLPPLAASVLLAALCTPQALAGSGPFHLIATGGLVIANGGGQTQSLKNLTGGIGVSCSVNRVLEVEPQVIYIEKGFSEVPAATIKFMNVPAYLEVPFLMRWLIPAGGAVHPMLVTGAFVGFKLSERLKITGALEDSAPSNHFDSPDWGLLIGAGIQVDRGPGRWILEARYEPSVPSPDLIVDNQLTSSRAWVISTGYRF